MAKIVADRVLETSTTTGTGAITLAGAVTGYRAFSAVCANADTAHYYIEEVDANGVPSGGWETGLGTWGTGNILTRTTVTASSNAGAAVNWGAGTRRVGLSLVAAAMQPITGLLKSNGVILQQAVSGTDYQPAGTYATGGGTATGTNTGDQTTITGNAGTATTLQTARTIGGSSFNGSANVTSFPAPGAIGGTTPSTGAFTSITATTTIAATGNVTGANLSGTNTGNQTITLTGDVTGSGTGSFAATLATVNGSPGSLGFAGNRHPSIVVNGKGLLTACADVTPSGTYAITVTGNTSGQPTPSVDNGESCGTGALRFSVIYSATGTINTSDARQKTPVRSMSPAEIDAAKQMGREIGVFKFLESVENKGQDARLHVGMTVQRAIEVMTSHGLDPMAYAFICYDEWEEKVAHFPPNSGVVVEHGYFDDDENWVPPVMGPTPAYIDASGNEVAAVEPHDGYTKILPAGNRYSFRPDQLLLFIARGFEARLTALENAL